MKKHSTIISLLLIGIGVYFLLQQYSIPYLSRFSTWPTLLIIFSIAFLINSYKNNDRDSIFPGIVLLGLGVHFHALNFVDWWTNHWGMYTLIVGLAHLIGSYKGKKSLTPGLILTIISLFVLMPAIIPSWHATFDFMYSKVEQFWPFILIIIGGFLLFKK